MRLPHPVLGSRMRPWAPRLKAPSHSNTHHPRARASQGLLFRLSKKQAQYQPKPRHKRAAKECKRRGRAWQATGSELFCRTRVHDCCSRTARPVLAPGVSSTLCCGDDAPLGWLRWSSVPSSSPAWQRALGCSSLGAYTPKQLAETVVVLC